MQFNKKILLSLFIFSALTFNVWADTENNAPIFDSIADKTVNEGEFLSFIITATDLDGDNLTYQASGLHEDAEFDNETQTFTWTPDFEQSGYHSISVSVSDGIDSNQVSITINVIDTHPLEAPTGLNAAAINDTIILNWDVVLPAELLAGYNIYRSTSDPGKYEKINNDLITETEYIDSTVEPETHYYYFVTAIDIFEFDDVVANDLTNVCMLASNDDGEIFAASYSEGIIWIIDNYGNSSIYASGLRIIGGIVYDDGNLYVAEYEPFDSIIKRITPAGEIYSYAEDFLFDYPSGLAFNSAGELFVSEDLSGNVFKVSDNSETRELFYAGLEGPVNLIIDELENLIVSEDLWIGDDYVGAINLIDQAGNLTVLTNLEDPDGISLDKSGNLYVVQSSLNQISKVMSDSSYMPMIKDFKAWDCLVNKYNELFVASPWSGIVAKLHHTHESEISDKTNIVSNEDIEYNITPTLNPIGNKEIKLDQLLEFTISATDPDGNNLAYSVDNLPKYISCGTLSPTEASFDPETGTFSWTPKSGGAGTYQDIVFTVTDDGIPPLSDSETISITVKNINHAPIMDTIGNQTVAIGETLMFTVSATDPDNDNLTYSADNLPVIVTCGSNEPSGAEFDNETRMFSWTPKSNQLTGTYPNVVFTATDDGTPMLSGSKIISITVTN